jgi:hypothetical protein
MYIPELNNSLNYGIFSNGFWEYFIAEKIFRLFIYYNASKARRKCEEMYRKLWKHEILNIASLLVFWSPQNCAAISLTLRLLFITNTFFLNKGAKPFLRGLLHFYSVTCFPFYIAKYTEGNTWKCFYLPVKNYWLPANSRWEWLKVIYQLTHFYIQ